MDELSVPQPDQEKIESGPYANAMLIGREDGKKVFWLVGRKEIVKTENETPTPSDAGIVGLTNENVGEYIQRTAKDGSVWSLNQLGKFFRNVSPFENMAILTTKQQEAYALCYISDIDEATAADLLDLPKSRLDDQLSEAHKKITCAFNLAASVSRF